MEEHLITISNVKLIIKVQNVILVFIDWITVYVSNMVEESTFDPVDYRIDDSSGIVENIINNFD